MSVRHSLLAILDQGPCYGYQLRAEYARRTGVKVPLNVGQVYTTLERLERDGLVQRGHADERGHVYWGITDAGRADAREWLRSATTVTARDEVVRKVALAVSLPGVDAAAVVAAQRDIALQRVARAREQAASDLTASIAQLAEQTQAEAEVEWLDAAATLIDEDGGRSEMPLSDERPRRGRPARAR